MAHPLIAVFGAVVGLAAGSAGWATWRFPNFPGGLPPTDAEEAARYGERYAAQKRKTGRVGMWIGAGIVVAGLIAAWI